jgi:hypothetical protein
VSHQNHSFSEFQIASFDPVAAGHSSKSVGHLNNQKGLRPNYRLVEIETSSFA